MITGADVMAVAVEGMFVGAGRRGTYPLVIRRRPAFRPSRKLRRELRPVYRAWKHYKRAATPGARDQWLYKLSHALDRHLARRAAGLEKQRARRDAALEALRRLITASLAAPAGRGS